MNLISAEELKDLLQTNKDNLIVVNVLEPLYYNKCHIAGSKNIPSHDRNAFITAAKNLDTEKDIILYCANYACPASKNAYNALVETGDFDETKLFAYEGGIQEWKEKGFATEGTEC